MASWQTLNDFPGLAVKLKANRDGRLVVVALRLEAPAITSDLLRQIPVAQIEADANVWLATEPDDGLPELTRGDRSAEDFSRLVAGHYQAWARRFPNAAKRLADRWNVNPATMASWVREARLRGFLPPAHRGKAAS